MVNWSLIERDACYNPRLEQTSENSGYFYSDWIQGFLFFLFDACGIHIDPYNGLEIYPENLNNLVNCVQVTENLLRADKSNTTLFEIFGECNVNAHFFKQFEFDETDSSNILVKDLGFKIPISSILMCLSSLQKLAKKGVIEDKKLVFIGD